MKTRGVSSAIVSAVRDDVAERIVGIAKRPYIEQSTGKLLLVFPRPSFSRFLDVISGVHPTIDDREPDGGSQGVCTGQWLYGSAGVDIPRRGL